MTKEFFNTNIFRKAAFILSCFFFSACENDPKLIEDLTSNKVLVEEATDIKTFLSQNGQMKARLIAPYMLRYQSDTIYVEFPRSLHVDFYDSTGRMGSHVDALYGKYFENQNKVYLRDSVVVYNTQGDTLRCPDLWWDQGSQRVFTDKDVRIRKGQDIFFGKGLEAKQDLSEINIKRATGRVLVKEGF